MVDTKQVKINKREFQRFVGKYLKAGSYYVEVSDKWVKILSDNSKCQTKVSDSLDCVSTGKGKISLTDKQLLSSGVMVRSYDGVLSDAGKYGCGCSKVEGKPLCGKHQRV